MSEKTNVMRILDTERIPYETYDYSSTGAVSGVDVAKALNQNVCRVFKTLVTKAKSGKYYVFLVPVAEELNLKKAAAAVGEKSLEMIPQKELLPTTGYVHGGCSPIGMKKQFKTVIDESAEFYDRIIFSAGKIGHQVELDPYELQKLVGAKFEEITK